MSLPQQSSVYDRLRDRLDATDLLRRLNVPIVRELGSEAYCAPLCHESSSGESLQINLHTGRWNCKACQESGVYGDLIQLVEYILSRGNAPTHGAAQGGSASHREAMRWLCEQYAIPYEEAHGFGDPALDIVHVFAMQAHRYLLGAPEVLRWIEDRWGFDQGTVEAYGIGYMPDPILPELASEAARSESRGGFRSSGIGFYPQGGTFTTRFSGRVIFPYLEHGRAVYLIGRATPWTPRLDSGAPAPKYHKLSVHSEQRPYVSERITNDHLYNEPVLSSTDVVVVAEGVADAVALSSLGIPVVSPVTISFNATDLERFVRKARAHRVHRVEILFDNELSGSGSHGARRVAAKLVERGLSVTILTLPLGPEQVAARDEVLAALGPDLFDELERADPKRRKEIIAEAIADDSKRAWVIDQVNASKIDAAEWAALEGAGAAGRFNQIRRDGMDVVGMAINEAAATIDTEGDADIYERLNAFSSAITLAAHVDERLVREGYASLISRKAGKGITKAGILQKISEERKRVKAERSKDSQATEVEVAPPKLLLLPPDNSHSQPPAPALPMSVTDGDAPAPPPPPGETAQSEHDRYTPVRESVMRSVEAKIPEEIIGQHVAQTITLSMGYTPFRTPDELYLVRGNERVPTGLDRPTPQFAVLLYCASGLTSKKTSHRAYIAAAVYFLEHGARRARDVSWSHVDADGSVYFPTGDLAGRIIRISQGETGRTRMSEARVPAVAGQDFRPINYSDENGGIAAVVDTFRWTSLSSGDRLVLVHWLVCLPILRKIGTVPIVRIEGGSSSGKTRIVDAVSYLVNGGKSSSVPTAAALISRMSTEMLTIDDNREAGDVTPAFRGTLLQATNLGAREKRKANSDTGTVVERVCGALLMNGIEPIHDGRSELASRILTLRCDRSYRAPDSPVSSDTFSLVVLQHRDRFWSEALRRCSVALELDAEWGEPLGSAIEAVFGETRIGRLSSYLRLMYLAWVAGLPPARAQTALVDLDAEWFAAFSSLGQHALDSLIREELAVAALRYAFAWGESTAERAYPTADEAAALDGKFVVTNAGHAALGPMSAPQLARVVRTAGRELNAPRALSVDLRAGQLEARLLDGIGFLEAAGYQVEIVKTNAGRRRFTFYRRGAGPQLPPGDAGEGHDTWVGP